MCKVNASDLYLTVGSLPMMRNDKSLIPVGDTVLSEQNIRILLPAILNEQQLATFERDLELNLALDLGAQGRFRVNVLMQKYKPAMVIRRIITEIPNFEELRLPSIYAELAMERRGLILVAGMTGSGKSTSLASMIDYRNSHESGHIVTIEDPIEYYHQHKKSIVTQREVGVDTHSYQHALKSVLRQRPDVILIGEIRDVDVMEQALACSETGHLCLATVHANNAYQAIERVINFFPEEQAAQVRSSLASNLKGVVSQRLVTSIQGGVVPALEVMLNQALVRELIAKGETHKISDVMEKNAMIGMRTFDMSLLELYKTGVISEQAVIENSDKSAEIKVKLQAEKSRSQKPQVNSPLANAGHSSTIKDENTEKDKDALLGYIDTASLSLHD